MNALPRLLPLLLGLAVALHGAAAFAVLNAAVLPASRSTQAPGSLTAFATVINSATVDASGCRIELVTSLPATLGYQTTNPATNEVTGTANTPVTIGAGASQSFVFSLTTSDAIAPTEAQFSFVCDNAGPAGIVAGVNTLLVSASVTPVPDVVALAATNPSTGILALADNAGAFSVATVNLGASDTIDVSVDTGAAQLPLTIAVCETNPVSGNCVSALAATIQTMIDQDATPTFSVFASSSDTVPLDAAANRIFVRFRDSSGQVRGATSVAVEGGSPSGVSDSALAVVDRVIDVLVGSSADASPRPALGATGLPKPAAATPVDETLLCNPGSVRFVGTVDQAINPVPVTGTMTFNNCDTINGSIGVDGGVRVTLRSLDVDLTIDGTVSAQGCESVGFMDFDMSATATPIGIITSPIIATGTVSATCAGETFQCTPMGIDVEDDDAFAASCTVQ